MNEELKRYLDGEVDASELSAELKREAEAWDAFLVDVRESGATGAPVGLETRVVEAIRAERRPLGSRLVDWWVHPKAVRVRPLIGLAAAAAIAALFLLPPESVPSGDPGGGAATLVGAGEEAIYYHFTLNAPEASSVALAGSFNEWAPEIELADPDGDGVWSGRVLLPPGVHRYMFVIDGDEWITDPQAERYVEDGFGNRNAVIALPGGGGAGALAP